MAQKEIRQIYPKPGWVEQDPQEIWFTQLAVAVEALPAPHQAEDIAAIGITNQRETTVVWDRDTGDPSITPSSGRIGAPRGLRRVERAGHDELIQRKHRPASRRLLLRHQDRAGFWTMCPARASTRGARRARLRHGRYLAALEADRRQHVHVTDVSNASRTLLYNIHTGDWDEELLRALRIPRAHAAGGALRPAKSMAKSAAGLLGTRIPIGGIAGDQQAALFGQTCLQPGHGQEHLRHRLLPADEYRHEARRLQATAC